MRSLIKYELSITMIIVVIVNFLVKGIFLSSNSLGGDEPFSVYHAQMNISSIINLLSEGNNPPLYEIILHFWIKLFGIYEFSVRFPSLIFSCITVLFIYKLGIKYLNKRIALYSSIVFIFSNYHIIFAHEARVYAMLGMLSIISMYLFMGVLSYLNEKSQVGASKSNVYKKLIPLIIINVLIIYSHYFGFFILLTQLLFILFNSTIISNYYKQILICIGLIGLLYLPNIVIVLNRAIVSASHGTWVSPPNGVDSIYNMFRQFSNAPVVTVCVISVIILVFFKYIINRKKHNLNIYFSLIVFWFAFVFFFMFGISYLVPMFMDRYLMPAAIAFCLLLGISVDYLIKIPKYNLLIPAIICLLFIVTTKPNITNKRNVKETVEIIKEIKDINTMVLICPSNFILNFVYYYNKDVFKDFNDIDIYSNIHLALGLDNIYGISNIKEIDLEKWDNIIYLDAAANFQNPDNNIKEVLDAKYNIKNKYEIYEIFNIYEYDLK